MKHYLLSTVFAVTLSTFASAQFFNATLEINQVRTTINSTGDLFWNLSTPSFEVPIDSSKNVIFAGGIWLGGLDSNNALHVAAQTYRQSGGDFYPGPVMDSLAYSTATDAQWNNIWKINKTTIDSFLMWFNNPSAFPGYTIPSVLVTWPGNGNVALGQAAQLAPFIDRNGDGLYNPNNGDYPCIKGDQALFLIFNDDRNTHGETGGAKLKVEVHLMMYAYNAPGTWLDSAIFTNYKVYNRSTNNYEEVYFAQFTDFDIGDGFDDYVACDVTRNITYGYNADANDGSSALPGQGTYGANPPAEGLVFLKGPDADAGDLIDNNRNGTIDEPGEVCMMNYHMVYNNDFSITGNPQTADDFYDYMGAYWKDSSPATSGANGYGGATTTDFMYPGTSDPMGWGTNFVPQPTWDEAIAGNSPGDRRSLASSGAFTLESGGTDCVDFAYVFGRGNNGPSSSVSAMQLAADSAHAFYSSNNPCTCDPNPLGISETQNATIGIYPNPATDNINIICGDNSIGAQIEIIDATGKLVHTSTVLSGNSAVVDVTNFTQGIYFVRINKGSVVLTGKFIRN